MGGITYSGDIAKIDSQATDGLLGVVNSLSYRVHEIDRHLHSGASWFQVAGTPSGETHVADRIGVSGGAGAFTLDAGNDDWGTWVQILGSSDTPARTSMAYFDPHLVLVHDVERLAPYFVQFTRGDSGAAGLSAGTYTEWMYDTADKKDTSIQSVQTGRAPAGAKIWARCMCPGQNTGTMEIYMGIHEYEG